MYAGASSSASAAINLLYSSCHGRICTIRYSTDYSVYEANSMIHIHEQACFVFKFGTFEHVYTYIYPHSYVVEYCHLSRGEGEELRFLEYSIQLAMLFGARRAHLAVLKRIFNRHCRETSRETLCLSAMGSFGSTQKDL